MSDDIAEAKRRLPLPDLMRQLGLGEHAKKSARCPFHDDRHNSFSVWQNETGTWFWKCHAGCGEGDEITFLEAQRRISNSEATKLYLQLAGVKKTTRLKVKYTTEQPFDWRTCVDAFTDAVALGLRIQRGYSIALCRGLKQNGLIGMYQGCFAFPVHDSEGNVVAVHYRLEDGSWRYFPEGAKARPLVIRELVPGEPIHVFESQWDAFAYMDKSGERSGIIITRGASNTKLAVALIPKGSTVYLWTQNDEPDPKTGIKAGENWQSDFCGALTEPTVCVKRVLIPAHDLNDWSRNGASTNDLLDAVMNAEILREAAPVSLEDFHAYMPMHQYIFVPARDIWPAASVNARIPPEPLMRNGKPVLGEDGKQKFISASAWLDQNRPVEQMTWAPGLPMLIKNRLISQGGWIHRDGCSTFNLYRPPTIKPGDATKAGPWLDHVKKLYPNDINHILRWFACRVQRPHEKINHALFLGGDQGIGKDTILYPVKQTVGQWNVEEILPPMLLGRFNGFVKSILLCINEAHDLGDFDRYALYERLKAYTAAPPDVLRVDEKNLREYALFNVCGVILTSNHKTSGLYLPADDRRHYVAWSDVKKDDFSEEYWPDIYAWYDLEGCRHVAAYLAELDISDFNPKAPPPKTDAFWEVVDSNRAPENAELADALEHLDNPDVVTILEVIETRWVDVISSDFADWLKDGKNARQIPYRFEEVGYVPVRNPDHKGEGRWMIGKKRCVIYAKKTLSKRDQLAKARAKAEAGRTDA